MPARKSLRRCALLRLTCYSKKCLSACATLSGARSTISYAGTVYIATGGPQRACERVS